MKELFVISASGAAISVFSEIPMKIAQFLKRKRLRPFTCEFCLSTHIGWIWYHFHNNLPWLESIGLGLTAGTIAIFITHYAKR